MSARAVDVLQEVQSCNLLISGLSDIEHVRYVFCHNIKFQFDRANIISFALQCRLYEVKTCTVNVLFLESFHWYFFAIRELKTSLTVLAALVSLVVVNDGLDQLE